MSDLDIIKAMLNRAGIGHVDEDPDYNDDRIAVVNIDHDGFTHCFTQWKFTREGKLLGVTAGY